MYILKFRTFMSSGLSSVIETFKMQCPLTKLLGFLGNFKFNPPPYLLKSSIRFAVHFMTFEDQKTSNCIFVNVYDG